MRASSRHSAVERRSWGRDIRSASHTSSEGAQERGAEEGGRERHHAGVAERDRHDRGRPQQAVHRHDQHAQVVSDAKLERGAGDAEGRYQQGPAQQKARRAHRGAVGQQQLRQRGPQGDRHGDRETEREEGADPLVLAAALGGRLANGHLLEPEVPDGGADLDNGQRGGPLAEAVVTQGAGKQHRDHHPGNQVQRPADDLDPHVQSCARPPHMHAAAHRSRSTAI